VRRRALDPAAPKARHEVLDRQAHVGPFPCRRLEARLVLHAVEPIVDADRELVGAPIAPAAQHERRRAVRRPRLRVRPHRSEAAAVIKRDLAGKARDAGPGAGQSAARHAAHDDVIDGAPGGEVRRVVEVRQDPHLSRFQ
jgi:hypothetical protein